MISEKSLEIVNRIKSERRVNLIPAISVLPRGSGGLVVPFPEGKWLALAESGARGQEEERAPSKSNAAPG